MWELDTNFLKRGMNINAGLFECEPAGGGKRRREGKGEECDCSR
jgi:hypothetical protein